jgi:hypothetical protein
MSQHPFCARTFSWSRHHDHTQTLVRPLPLDECSARRRDFYLTTHNDQKRERQPCLRRDSNPQSQQAKRAAADPRLRPCGQWDLYCLRTHAVKNLLYASNMLQKDKSLFQSKVYTKIHFISQIQPTQSPSHRPIS